MGKNDFLTPKAIANRIKSKGLQKLRWYCQLCQKQCRDENGFKCHQTSEGHRRQMELFGMNAHRVVSGYSEEFEKAFMDHLRHAHPFSRVLAKNVYNEYITDRNHVHMNATKWLTLTEFVKYLGRSGQCKVDETEKGWYITLIHKDPQQAIEEEKRSKREEAEREEEERHMAALQEQIDRAKRARLERGEPPSDAEGGSDDEAAHELQRDEDGAPITLSLAAPTPAAAAAAAAAGAAGPSSSAAAAAAAGGRGLAAAAGPSKPPAAVFGDDDDDDDAEGRARGARPPGSGAGGRGGGGGGGKRSKVEELMQAELRAKSGAGASASSAAAGGGGGGKRLDYWLAPGIVVKVLARELQRHGLYKQKGVVLRVIDRYVGELSVMVPAASGSKASKGDKGTGRERDRGRKRGLEGGGKEADAEAEEEEEVVVVRVDQAQLETVIPSPGGRVLVVNGEHRGARGTLVQIDTGKFQAQVRLLEGPSAGKEVWLEYEDVCKLDGAGGGGGGGKR